MKLSLNFTLRALCSFLFFASILSMSFLDDLDVRRDPCELMESRGFACLVYFPVTKDGYILTLHRIVNPLISPPIRLKGPVLLMHGLFGSAADWLIAAPGGDARAPVDTSKVRSGNLGFELANHGHDVWLGNFRGNWYATNHTRLSPDLDHGYWDFSFDHHALHDLPAITGVISRTTGRRSLGYIGHSMGGDAVLALLAAQPEKYTSVFKPAILMAASGRLTNTRSNGLRLFANSPASDTLFSTLGGPFPPSNALQKFSNSLCQDILKDTCRSIFQTGGDLDMTNTYKRRFSVIINHYPQTTSAATFSQFIQFTKSNTFAKFSYGPEDNLRIYGQPTAPEYPLEDIRSPNIALIYSSGDEICTEKDIEWLISRLRVNLLDNYSVPVDGWSHHDFLWAKQAPRFIFARVLRLLNTNFKPRSHHNLIRRRNFWRRLDNEEETNAPALQQPHH